MQADQSPDSLSKAVLLFVDSIPVCEKWMTIVEIWSFQ